MIGRGEDGGCVTDEQPCISPVPASSPGKSPEKSGSVGLGFELYTQALKALAERSPFDSDEVLVNTSPTLPSRLASLLKSSDSRRKHKRQHTDSKASRKSSEKSKSLNIWVELEEYFRELKLQDIERLFRFSSPVSSLECTNPRFEIPVLGNVARNFNDHTQKVENGHAEIAVPVEKVAVAENFVKKENGHDENDLVSHLGAVEGKFEESKKQLVNAVESESRDSVGEQGLVLKSSAQPCSSIEWVLGSRNRVMLATTRPTKKRKLLGESAGLERLMVARPCEGKSDVCHICSMGETGDELNQLVVCSSCKVIVHQKCYGVPGEVDECWYCSWCKHMSNAEAGQPSSCDQPCVLCPKPGGASKRFKKPGNEGSIEFAHLFCSQWIPEVYIEDTRFMEPLLSVGVKDARGKVPCNLCKSKLGSCVRCSYGSCKTPIHPICAREAGNKLEIWGKFGCGDIELRAFCSRHSVDATVAGCGTLEENEQTHAVVGDSLGTSCQQGNKIKKLKIACKNGDKRTCRIGAVDDNNNTLRDEESLELKLKDIVNKKHRAESGDQQEFSEVEHPGHKLSEAVKTPFDDIGVLLNRFVDLGEVSLEQVATEIGTTKDYLAAILTDNHIGPEMSCKIQKWLTDHAYLDASEKDMSAKFRRLMPLKFDGSSESVAIMDLDMPDVVPVKSVPPRRRTVGNIVKEDKLGSRWNEKLLDNDELINEGTEQELVNGDHVQSSKDSLSDGAGKKMVETNGVLHRHGKTSPATEGTLLESVSPCGNDWNRVEERITPTETSVLALDQEPPSCSNVNTSGCCDGDVKSGTDSFVHPYNQKELDEVQCSLSKKAPGDCNGLTEANLTARELLPTGLVASSDKIDVGEHNNGVKLEYVHTAKEVGVLNQAPDNEVEGEIIYSQQWLLRNAVTLKNHADQLVCKVVKSVPHEMDGVRKQRWDDVLAHQYIHELKEARKQGRKERRHKEAQAVLAAATAAAAASSRISSMRKDALDESPQQENQLKLEGSRLRVSLSSLSVTRTKESNSALNVPKAASDRYPDMFQYASGLPKEHLKSCDICRRTESLLNPILVCLSCKVAVHLNCYRSVKESTGPWYCELCEESSSSKASRSTIEKPFPFVECGLCGCSNGAFRKSSNGQWVHAFCAEWVFDLTFRRGQVYPVAGMETVLKGNDMCSVCHRRIGVCIKCNYGNCQSTFHPSCARSAGYYMYTKYIGGGKMQHKAYCSKHSLEQRAKVETQKHGVEDLKVVKQHRVELEKLRLLCERIVKREKLKRELVLCNHDILVSKRDSLAFSMLVRRPFLSHEASSESATTSLRGHSRSYSEAMQKSDDVTVDSVLSSKLCIRLPLSVDTDQKTDDSSTSQCTPTPKPTEGVLFAGKQIPVRAAMAGRNFSQSAEKMLKSRKNTETFEKELVMTSDQASMRNRRLPKGYFYVPLDSLSNGKLVSHDSLEREEVDR